MRLAEEIRNYGSVAVVGMAKNVGKTESLNYFLRETSLMHWPAGVTSIGLDGESVDAVTATRKPEIILRRGMLFATSETHYRTRRLEAEILHIDTRRSALGRIVTARALSDGKVLLSGPAETSGIKEQIRLMKNHGAQTVFVDGALSRLSPASPAVTDAMILATGGAISPDIAAIVKKTAFTCRLINLPEVQEDLRIKLHGVKAGIAVATAGGEIKETDINSTLEFEKIYAGSLENYPVVYAKGMVGERFLKFLTRSALKEPVSLIVTDFTRLFVEPATFSAFLNTGSRVSVMKKTMLIGVTANPWSPYGFTVNKEKLLNELQCRLSVPVIDIRDL